MQRNEPPCGRDLRQLISHTVSDIFSFTRRASRDNLRAIARKIVSHNPKSFADYINGKVVGDGIRSQKGDTGGPPTTDFTEKYLGIPVQYW